MKGDGAGTQAFGKGTGIGPGRQTEGSVETHDCCNAGLKLSICQDAGLLCVVEWQHRTLGKFPDWGEGQDGNRLTLED